MTAHRLRFSTVSASLCTAVAAVFLASAPISSAAAAGSNAATGGLEDLQSQCGTLLAQPGFASGATLAACQGYASAYGQGDASSYGMNSEPGPGEYPARSNPSGMYGSSHG